MDKNTSRKTLSVARQATKGDDLSNGIGKRAPILKQNKKQVMNPNQPIKSAAKLPKNKKPVSPSTIRQSELNKALSQYSKAWRAHRPLASDIEKQIFKFIGANQLSSSKRVVQLLLKKHLRAKNYLLNTVMDADLVISFKVFRERFTSRVTLWPAPQKIDTEYLDGPFKYMKSNWSFEDAEGGGCHVQFFVDFEFKNAILQGIIGIVFNEAMQRVVRAFEARAEALYTPTS